MKDESTSRVKPTEPLFTMADIEEALVIAHPSASV